MTTLGRRFARLLPDWLRREYPALRRELGPAAGAPARARYLRALLMMLAGLALTGGGYLIATDMLTHEPGANPVEALNRILYYPALLLQLILIAAAFSLTIGKVAGEVRQQNWDTLRATPNGVELSLYARWAAVFHWLRPLLGAVLTIRIILLIGLLWDLTAFQGRYLDLLISGITPETSLPLAVVLLALLMTAALLLPVTSIGLSAALGLFLSTMLRHRTYITLVQVVYLLLRIGAALGLVWAAGLLLNGSLLLNDTAAWLLIATAALCGDWGLALLALGLSASMWASIPYGILMGAALLVAALLQAAMADQLLRRAVRRAQKME